MIELNLNPCTKFTTDAIGKPGQRTFFIQGETDNETISLIYEKIQLQSLIVAIIRFFENLHEKYPDLNHEEGKFSETDMRITPPVDPLFRIEDLNLVFDPDQDKVCIVAKEIIFEQEDPASQMKAQDDARIVNYWCSRDQLSQFVNWGVELLQRGRPICPLCNEPIEPEGHLCPKKNGHKKH
jgi:uncharacterized repeat protein (TIGR03847 family)